MIKIYLFSFFVFITGFANAQKSEIVYQSNTHHLLYEKLFFLHHLIENENNIDTSGLAALQPDVISDSNLLYLDSVANGFLCSSIFKDSSAKELLKLLKKNNLFDKTILALKKSNKYSQFIDSEKLKEIWMSEIKLSNQIINTYLLNEKGRYPSIDSASFKKNDLYYHSVIKQILAMQNNSSIKFKELHFAIELLEVNNRNESVRYDPLEKWNKNTLLEINNKTFLNYDFSSILVLGEGPENSWHISPNTKLRCKLAARLFLDKKAPLLIVSGGHSHPIQTPFCEALEMKKYLVEELNVPEKFIIIEPYARHTTTNIRNANRLMLNYSIPSEKQTLVVSSQSHIDYLCSPEYLKRCKEEMGIIPFFNISRINPFSAAYFPTKESLQISLDDPLDP